jgi:hypothetical protein
MRMHRYEFTYVLDPPDVFGLPLEGRVVLPAGPHETNSPTIDSRTGNTVGYGTLSQFRRHTERLQCESLQNAVHLRIEDNFLFASFQSEQQNSAFQQVAAEVYGLCAMVSAMFPGRHLTPTLLQSIEDGSPIWFPEQMMLLSVHVYSIEMLHRYFTEASALLNGLQVDDRLSLAFDYFQKGGALSRLLAEEE